MGVAIIVPKLTGGPYQIIGAIASGAAATTWNPSDKASGITLSNSNRTAIFPSGVKALRSVAPLNGGKQYWEIVINVLANPTEDYAYGIANAIHSLTIACYADTNSAGYYPPSNGIFINFSSALTGLAHAVQGDVIDFAVDSGAKLMWVRLNGAGNWNGSGTANPATGAGGYDFSAVTGPYYITCDMNQFADQATLNAASGDWAGTPPSGFANQVQ